MAMVEGFVVSHVRLLLCEVDVEEGIDAKTARPSTHKKMPRKMIVLVALRTDNGSTNNGLGRE